MKLGKECRQWAQKPNSRCQSNLSRRRSFKIAKSFSLEGVNWIILIPYYSAITLSPSAYFSSAAGALRPRSIHLAHRLQPAAARQRFKLGSNLLHIGILLVFLGHFVGLLTPPAVYHSLGLSTSAKQLLAVIAGGIFGGVCLKGIIILIRRRLTDARIRATSSRMDIFILLLSACSSCWAFDVADLALSPRRQHAPGPNGRNALLPSVAGADRRTLFHLQVTPVLGITLFLVFHSAVWCMLERPLGYISRPTGGSQTLNP
jgi:nitrate reductase gamma subunit